MPTGLATSCHQSLSDMDDTQSVLTETMFKHLIQESSLNHTLHGLQYCNSARRDSRRKSTSEPEVTDRETQTHNNRKCSFFSLSLSLSAKSGQQTLTPHALLHTQRSPASDHGTTSLLSHTTSALQAITGKPKQLARMERGSTILSTSEFFFWRRYHVFDLLKMQRMLE